MTDTTIGPFRRSCGRCADRGAAAARLGTRPRVAEANRAQRFDFARVDRHQHFFDVGKGAAFTLGARLRFGQVIETENHVLGLDGALRLVPRRSIRELRGIAKGLRWKDEHRDHSERF